MAYKEVVGLLFRQSTGYGADSRCLGLVAFRSSGWARYSSAAGSGSYDHVGNRGTTRGRRVYIVGVASIYWR